MRAVICAGNQLRNIGNDGSWQHPLPMVEFFTPLAVQQSWREKDSRKIFLCVISKLRLFKKTEPFIFRDCN